jgi:hypothetical protein
LSQFSQPPPGTSPRTLVWVSPTSMCQAMGHSAVQQFRGQTPPRPLVASRRPCSLLPPQLHLSFVPSMLQCPQDESLGIFSAGLIPSVASGRTVVLVSWVCSGLSTWHLSLLLWVTLDLGRVTSSVWGQDHLCPSGRSHEDAALCGGTTALPPLEASTPLTPSVNKPSTPQPVTTRPVTQSS